MSAEQPPLPTGGGAAVGAPEYAATRRLIEQYFHGVDHLDADAVAECFARDGILLLGSEPPQEHAGRAAIRALFAQPRPGFSSSVHSVANHVAFESADRLTAITYATAYLLYDDAGAAAKVTVRGLRYEDEFVREDLEWRIVRRIHRPLWQFEAASTSVAV